MTIAREITEKNYTSRTVNEDVVLPERSKELRISLSRLDWPEGEVATVDVLYPDGTVAATFGMSGGTGKRSNTVIIIRNINGLPPGTYRMRFNVKQALRTAILFEGNETFSEITVRER